MKRKSAILFLSALLLCGCSGSKTDDSAAPTSESTAGDTVAKATLNTQSKDSQTLNAQLSAQGWQVQATTPEEMGIFTEQRPAEFLIARQEDGRLLFLARFDSEQTAVQAYNGLLPDNEETVREDGGNYQQAVVTLDNGVGIWELRQIGDWVFGGKYNDPSQQQAFIDLFNSFQADT